jgi:hypothetical protein
VTQLALVRRDHAHMSFGMLEKWSVRVLVYGKKPVNGKAPAPLVFGLSDGGSLQRGSQISKVEIVRRMNEEAKVTVQLASNLSPSGQRWSDVIEAGDWVRIEACVMRNPDSLSQKWRTIFFGVVHFSYGINSHSSSGAKIEATCALGWLGSNKNNYWAGTPETFANGGSERFRALLGAGGEDALFSNSAKLMDILMRNLVYANFPMFRSVQTRASKDAPVETRELRWRDTHGYRFESDAFAQGINLDQFAPHTQTWLQSLQNIVDVPAFYQMYSDVVPRSRVMASEGIGVGGRGKDLQRIYKKDSGFLFPAGDGYEDTQFMDALIVRPIPFPEYHDPSKDASNFGALGYDSRAWDNLPILDVKDGVGAIQVQENRNLYHQYSYYMTEVSSLKVEGGSSISSDIVAAFIANTIWDFEKYKKLVGYQPYVTATRRLPIMPAQQEIAIKPRLDKNGNFIGDARANMYGSSLDDDKQRVANLAQFAEKLNETLFSYHQYNDEYLETILELPLELRAELGIRATYERNKKIGFVDGYMHFFEPSGAGTVLYLTHVLPVEKYQNELPKHLGRKRPNDEFEPLKVRQLPAELRSGSGLTLFDRQP